MSLGLDRVAGQAAPQAVRLCVHDPARWTGPAALADAGALRAALEVRVSSTGDDGLPPVSGRHEAGPDGLRFTPSLPFAAGVRYRAVFKPGVLGWPGGPVTLAFGEDAAPGAPPQVEHIFPSGDELPENLLRFHVCFSQPMRRGSAATEITLLGPDGQEVPDALYRAPVELWDRDMRRLTVLLDPGRLKRGVGPNRALGPPLRAGQVFALSIGTGMAARSGHRLSAPVAKRFRATAPVREAITAAGWDVVAPAAGSRETLRLRFSRPLDWALLPRCVRVTGAGGLAVHGIVAAGCGETEARFTPAEPWAAAAYVVWVSAELEDVCGNHGGGPFDRPLRSGPGQADAVAPMTFGFRIASDDGR